MSKTKAKPAFSKSEAAALGERFLHFGEIWSLALRIVRRNFRRVLVPIFLAKTGLVFATALAIGGIVGLLVNFSALPLQIELADERYSLSEPAGLSEELSRVLTAGERVDLTVVGLEEVTIANPGLFLGMAAMVGVIFLAFAWQIAYLELRTYQLLKDPAQSKVWRFKGAAGSATFRFFAGQLLSALLLGLLWRFLIPVFGPGAAEIYRILAQGVFLLLCGLYRYRLAFNHSSLWRSFRESYRRTIEVVWAHAARWLLFGVVLFGAAALVSVAGVLVVTLGILGGGWWLFVNLFTAVFFLFLAVSVVELFTQVFGWVAYENLDRLYSSKKGQA